MNSIEEAIEAIKSGQFVVVVDDEDRENEGDLIIAAEKVTPEQIAFMVKHTSGILCVAMEGRRLDDLDIPLMVNQNTEALRTAFTISVDYKHGTTTGVSAKERALTIQNLANPNCTGSDFLRPGHVFPLRYAEGGVLKRAGHTEASVDLARLAGLKPVGALSEIVNEDGSMARLDDLKKFAKKHNLKIISIDNLIKYRRRFDSLILKKSEARLPTKFGAFKACVFESLKTKEEHFAMVMGDLTTDEPVLVRVHSECLTGDAFGSLRCDCGLQLQKSLELVAQEKRGVVLYLRGQEGRGIGLGHKIHAYELQDKGYDTVEANLKLGFPSDSREYGIGAEILASMGITKMRLMTNNPNKYVGLTGFGLEITERIPLLTDENPENKHYLATKKHKMGHLL